MDALATVLLTQPCTTVHGVHNILDITPHHSTVKATAPSRVVISCYRLRVLENRTRNIPSGKMLLERSELHQCQGSCGQPVRSKSRMHLEGVSVFFFLHCRTSARHCRSTTGMSEERNQISPKAKANKNKHTNQTKQHPQNQTRQRSREICKLGETGETSASLSSPSQILFRQVVLPHVVHV